MKFTKMHGLGNDYVYVNGFVEKVADPGAVSRVIADRHCGIGSDGLIMILPSDKADVRMRMFNADGSEGEMCGNGIRCLAKYSYDHGLTKNNPMTVETGRGVLTLDLKTREGKVEQVTVNMGVPSLDLEKIPVNPERVTASQNPHEYYVRVPVAGAPDKFHRLPMTFVNVGNPHGIIFVDDLKGVALAEVGPVLEKHPAFPRRANIHWAQVISPREIRIITWERGSGITMACGTGASATVVAAILTGRSEREVLVHLPGGDLQIEWRKSDNNVYMTGPATEVFSGEIAV